MDFFFCNISETQVNSLRLYRFLFTALCLMFSFRTLPQCISQHFRLQEELKLIGGCSKEQLAKQDKPESILDYILDLKCCKLRSCCLLKSVRIVCLFYFSEQLQLCKAVNDLSRTRPFMCEVYIWNIMKCTYLSLNDSFKRFFGIQLQIPVYI